MERHVQVPERSAGMRLDAWLAARFPDWSRRAAARAVREGRVRSADGRPLKPSSPVRGGERLSIRDPALAPLGGPPPCPPVLHEDEALVAFDKPAGLLCHPVGRRHTWGLINLARERFPGEALHLVHRLDRDTSGVVVLARGDAANRALKAAFKARRVRKRYLAVVRGVVGPDRLVVDAPLGSDEGSPIRIKQGVRPDGAPARTEVEVVRRLPDRTLVRCVPLTGRTHQIRVHLAHVGHPILGDLLYGQPPEVFLSVWEERPLPDLVERTGHVRQALHAERLELPHPSTGERLVLEAPLPPDLQELLGAPGAAG